MADHQHDKHNQLSIKSLHRLRTMNPLVYFTLGMLTATTASYFILQRSEWLLLQPQLAPSSDLLNASVKRKILNVLFFGNILNVNEGGGMFEFDWITNVLLGAIDRPIRILGWNDAKRSDTLYVFHTSPPSKTLFRELRQNKFVNQGVFHMADEGMSNDISYYPDVAYVFRNYYNAEYERNFSHVRWVPLGVKSGFGTVNASVLLPASQRKYECNFIGSLRSNRQEAILTVKRHGLKCYWDYEKEWAAPNTLNVKHYRNILRDSKFTLAPWGNNPESLRLYEGMETGSIPIFQTVENPNRHTLNGFGPNRPIPEFKTWSDAAEFMQQMLKRPRKLDELQAKIIAFYRDFKVKTQAEIKDIIDKSFKNTYGYDC